MNGRERLIEILKSQGLNAKQLSERINVSAGTISNIMGGRNKPSLELWQSVAEQFPMLNPSWVFMGKGDMYVEGFIPEQSLGTSIEPDLFTPLQTSPATKQTSVSAKPSAPSVATSPVAVLSRQIEKIVIFYSDGTFEER